MVKPRTHPRYPYTPLHFARLLSCVSGKNVLKKGTNGWTCMPANPRGMSDPDNGWLSAHEAMPVCFDAAGLDWMEGWMSQSKPVMKRDSYVWMLAGDMGEDNSTPMTMTQAEANGTWIESGPHLMLFPKKPPV